MITATGLNRKTRAAPTLLPLSVVATLTFIAQFFNTFLFGAIGGDIVKVLYAQRYAPWRRTHATLSKIMDRMLGLFILLSGASSFTAFGVGSVRGGGAAPQESAVLFSLLFFALPLAWSAVGGLLYLTFRHDYPQIVRAR